MQFTKKKLHLKLTTVGPLRPPCPLAANLVFWGPMTEVPRTPVPPSLNSTVEKTYKFLYILMLDIFLG